MSWFISKPTSAVFSDTGQPLRGVNYINLRPEPATNSGLAQDLLH